MLDISYTQFAVADDISGAAGPPGRSGGGAITCVSRWGVSFDDESDEEDPEDHPLGKKTRAPTEAPESAMIGSEKNCDKKFRGRDGTSALVTQGCQDGHRNRIESVKRNYSDPQQYLLSPCQIKKRSTFRMRRAESASRRRSCPSLGKKSLFLHFLEVSEGGLTMIKPGSDGFERIQMTRSQTALPSFHKMVAEEGDFKHSFITSYSLPNIHIELEGYDCAEPNNGQEPVTIPKRGQKEDDLEELKWTHNPNNKVLMDEEQSVPSHPHSYLHRNGASASCSGSYFGPSLSAGNQHPELTTFRSVDGDTLPENRISIAHLAESLGLTPVTFSSALSPLVMDSGECNSLIPETFSPNQRNVPSFQMKSSSPGNVLCTRPSIPPKPQHLQQMNSVDSQIMPVPFRRRRRSDLKYGSLDDSDLREPREVNVVESIPAAPSDSGPTAKFPAEYVIPAFR